MPDDDIVARWIRGWKRAAHFNRFELTRRIFQTNDLIIYRRSKKKGILSTSFGRPLNKHVVWRHYHVHVSIGSGAEEVRPVSVCLMFWCVLSRTKMNLIGNDCAIKYIFYKTHFVWKRDWESGRGSWGLKGVPGGFVWVSDTKTSYILPNHYIYDDYFVRRMGSLFYPLVSDTTETYLNHSLMWRTNNVPAANTFP